LAAEKTPDIGVMPATPVYIIASPRPQVGKTVVARLVTEFLLLKNGNVTAFDINLKEPSLLDYMPDVTETADISDTYGKMELMDRVIVDDGMAKVIDLVSTPSTSLQDVVRDRLHEGSGTRNVAPIIMFMADIDRTSRAARNAAGTDSARQPDHRRQRIHHARRAAGGHGRRTDHAADRAAAVPEDLYRPADLLVTAICGQDRNSASELHQWIRNNYIAIATWKLELILQR